MRKVKRQSVVTCVAGSALALLGGSIATAQTCYRLTDIRALGFLPGSDNIFGLNYLGEAAFTAEVNEEKHAFVWLPNPNYGLAG
ncbi:MAG: hypothetical protein IH830_08945 [Planctomycetes bacterium]|nr:hypothetical protein [Planctomycetota bacterium]